MFLSTLQLQDWADVGQIYFSEVSHGKELSLDIKGLCIFLVQSCQPEGYSNGVIIKLIFFAHLFGAFRNDYHSSLSFRTPNLAG